MLVLTRRIGETIVLGTKIELTVAAVQGGKVKLAISAPAVVRIRRSELPGLHDPTGAATGSNSPGELRSAEC
jgi:carbon storage regulator